MATFLSADEGQEMPLDFNGKKWHITVDTNEQRNVISYFN